MNVFLTLIFLAATITLILLLILAALRYARHKDARSLKRPILASVIVAVLSMIVVALTAPKKAEKVATTEQTQTAVKKTSAKKTSASSKKATSKKPEYDFSKVALDMTPDQVIKAIGQPTKQDGDIYYYGHDVLKFWNGKLYNGSPKNISAAYDAYWTSANAASKAAKESQKEQAEKEAQHEETFKIFARTFGTKDVESIQRDGWFASTTINGQMAYSWKPEGYDTLIRIDTTGDQLTTVYRYDASSKNGLGEILYQGKTILQKRAKYYNYY